MQKGLRPSSMIPPGFAVVGSSIADNVTTITVRSTSLSSACPSCGTRSGRVHSRCRRQIADLPLARRLMLPVSNGALLRVVRRRGCPLVTPPTVIGIDDWAWPRNQRYGTIICDLERR